MKLRASESLDQFRRSDSMRGAVDGTLGAKVPILSRLVASSGVLRLVCTRSILLNVHHRSTVSAARPTASQVILVRLIYIYSLRVLDYARLEPTVCGEASQKRKIISNNALGYH